MYLHITYVYFCIFTVGYVSSYPWHVAATDFRGFRGAGKKAKASAEGPIARASSPGLEASREKHHEAVKKSLNAFKSLLKYIEIITFVFTRAAWTVLKCKKSQAAC